MSAIEWQHRSVVRASPNWSRLKSSRVRQSLTRHRYESARGFPFFISGRFSGGFFLSFEDDLLDLFYRERFYIGTVAFYSDEEDFFLALNNIILMQEVIKDLSYPL